VGDTFSWVETQLDNRLDCFLLQVDTCVYLDAPIVCILLHAGVEVTTVGINVLPFGGVEQFPDIGQVVAAVDPSEIHQIGDVVLGIPFSPFAVLSPTSVGCIPV
jgi:hypothetical protein